MSWGSTIRVPVDELLSAAEKLADYALECEGLLDRLENAVKALRGGTAWRGDSMEALQAVTENNSKQYGEITNDLFNLAGILEQYAKEMQDEDQQIKKEIG